MFSHREAIEPIGKRQLTGGAAGITRCNRRTPLTILSRYPNGLGRAG